MTTPSSQADIFHRSARHAKRQRAKARFKEHDFLHQRAAADVVDRLESILRPFERALFTGPAASLIKTALTPAAEVNDVVTLDEIEGEDVRSALTALPFEEDRFDLVVSTFALHAANDPLAVIKDALRVLSPDGLFVATFPGERSLYELREALRDGEAQTLGRVAPRVYPMMAVKDGGAMLQRAGFALPVADVARLNITYQDPWRGIQDLRGTGETSALLKTPKGALRRDVLRATLAAYQEKNSTEDGEFKVTIDLITLTGWKPHASQPKPLAPGSAKASMADAIKKMT